MAKASKELPLEILLEILYQTSQNMDSIMDLQDIFQKTMKVVAQMTGGDSCFLYLLNEGREELVLVASKNPHPNVLGKVRLKMGEGITGWVAREKEPVAIASNANKDPRFKMFQYLSEDKFQAFLSIPIIAGYKVLGVINVQHKNPHEYNDTTITSLMIIAYMVGSAISRTKLLERVSALEEVLETRKFIERAKGLLMKKYRLEEDEAYRLIQKRSMDTGCPMKEIAMTIITDHRVKKGVKSL